MARVCLAAGVWTALASGALRAQNVHFLPEVDAHLTLNSMWRTYLEAKDDRDGGASNQFSIGPSVQLYLKPLVRLRGLTAFDLNDAKKRVVVFESGYRYLTERTGGPYNRMETIVTFNFPLAAGFLVTDRNRADLDWKSSGFFWRYRNKLTIERTFGIGSYHLIPYVAAEPYYVSQYSKWSTTALYVGCLLPIGKHVEFNAYYEHENNTGKAPNTQDNDIGLALYLYFNLPKK